MFGREIGETSSGVGEAYGAAGAAPECRRAYYRVEALLAVRVRPLSPESVDSEIFDLSLPDPLLQPVDEAEADSPLVARLRRIEEKLDLLLGHSQIDIPQPLAGRDRQSVVFSGAGLCLDVDNRFEKGDAFAVEILLPPPHLRTVRAVGVAVSDAHSASGAGPKYSLALSLDHMEDEERDALVAYSYDLQRFELRTRGGEVPR